MREQHESSTRLAVFASRGLRAVTCPHCWTEQRTERDFCYQCGALFRYRDETAQPPETARDQEAKNGRAVS